MKKAIRLVFLLLLCILLTACQNTDFINLFSFIENYNDVCQEERKIDFGSFTCETQKDHEILTFFPYATNNVAVRLISDSKQQIGEARIVLRKTDKSGNPVTVSESDLSGFQSAAQFTCYALSNGEIQAVPEKIIPKSTADLSGNNEKTESSGSFYFIYYSNQLVSEIVIKNQWLSPVETTKKPENKKPFAEMTETRSNTVPHK